MNLKSLIHRELGEGLTEQQLAVSVGLSERTIANVLGDKLPKARAIWRKFGRYFRIHPDLLRSGGVPWPGQFELTEGSHQSRVGQIRKVPLLKWHQVGQMVARKGPPRSISAEALIETDVPGRRSFAMQVGDDSMQPLFNKGEIVFVNPDLPGEPGQYLLVESGAGRRARPLLRKLKDIGGQVILHPLNRRYEDLPLTKQQRILGRVVRLRKNL